MIFQIYTEFDRDGRQSAYFCNQKNNRQTQECEVIPAEALAQGPPSSMNSKDRAGSSIP